MESSVKELAFYRLDRAKEMLDKRLSSIIKETSLLREKSDYDDFYIAGKEETEKQFNNAKIFIVEIEEYLQALN